ncbi:glycosyltransferase family 4 protein [Marinobacter sp.]|uniref:glycosyltransferase family 4 protein n=1 Tax=Marinobacter sp. TaxID=50741 RepID=UPI002B27B1D3|nr:glycosyltransferase family 4 protein [Marinobacter sp.]
MKLSIIMDQYNNPYAGTESQVLKLISGLVERGWEVRFAVFRGTRYTRNGEFPVAIEELNIGSVSNPGSWFKAYRYGRKLKKNGFDLVHVFFNDASVLCPPTMSLAGLKTVISRRDMGFWYNKKYLHTLRLTGRFVSGAVCNSKAVAEITASSEGIPGEKIKVIYNGYPAESMQKTVPDDEDKQSDPIVIGVVANLRPIKRIDDLIKAVGKLRKTGLRSSLNIVGGGDQTPYAQLVGELGIQDAIQFLGAQAEPEKYIKDFDIAVLCSETEGFSNAIIEYMRCGKPVVCTRTGGNPEIIQDGENGYLVEVGDVSGLAEKLKTLIEQPELRERMGRKGAEKVTKKYNLNAMLDQHTALYETLRARALQ